jgi:ABC-type lipoprotein release transport system permease subunit
MKMFLKLAWRNTMRNKRRTVIAATAIGMGLAAMIFMDAIMIGFKNDAVRSVTGQFLGEGQIHAAGFRDDMEPDLTVRGLSGVVAGLRTDAAVDRFTLRVLTQGMLTSSSGVNGVVVVGVEPEREAFLSQIDDVIVRGDFFKESSGREIVIGSRLAELLEVDIGDRLVLTVAQAAGSELSQEMFRVSGIYSFNLKDMDSGMAFIRLAKAQSLLGIDGQVHEIALTFKNKMTGQTESDPFWARYSRNGNEALGWVKLQPQMKSILELVEFALVFLGLILFILVALGIVNTLFMSIYERVFEFGVMRAVGTRPLGVWRLIVFEAGSLAVLSIGLGLVLGLAATLIAARLGFNYQGVEFAKTTFNVIYPVLELRQFLVYPLFVLIFTMLAGVYPAIHGARLIPAKALRRTM